MFLYRISRSKYIKDLTGIGAKEQGGRWNNMGTLLIYTSDSASLAVLEFLANIKLSIAPKNLSIAKINLPGDLPIESIEIQDLPVNWHLYPAPKMLADLGSDWVKSNSSVALTVPSAQVPDSPDRNYLLNLLHPDFYKIRIEEVIAYSFDKRLVS